MSNDKGYQRALDFAYFYLKFRPRTKKEVVNYLNKKSEKYFFSQEIIDKIVKQLEELDLINDKKFIEWFVDQRNRAKPKSQFALTAELLHFGIEKDLINYFFQDSPQNEESLAQQALNKRWSQYSRLPKKECFQKSASFLSRRGFNFEIINKVISNCLEEKKE